VPNRLRGGPDPAGGAGRDAARDGAVPRPRETPPYPTCHDAQMRRGTAAIGTPVFFLVAPGVVVGLVPWWLTGWNLRFDWPLVGRIAGLVPGLRRHTDGLGPAAEPDLPGRLGRRRHSELPAHRRRLQEGRWPGPRPASPASPVPPEPPAGRLGRGVPQLASRVSAQAGAMQRVFLVDSMTRAVQLLAR
jgi:hypothetical protein